MQRGQRAIDSFLSFKADRCKPGLCYFHCLHSMLIAPSNNEN
jgi:hypothetical protein